MSRVELPIGGMTCAGCAARVERTLNGLDGVTATVNLATEKAAVEYDEAVVGPEALVEAVEGIGYSARLVEPEAGDPLLRRLVTAAVLTVPVVALGMASVDVPWLMLALATP